MKKFFVAILALLYFVTTTGTTVHLHYCMGKLVSVDLQQSTTDACSKCGMDKTRSGKDCCKEEQQQVKIEKEHQKTETVFQPIVPVAPAPSFSIVASEALASITEANPSIHAPPNCSGPALLKRICTYRI